MDSSVSWNDKLISFTILNLISTSSNLILTSTKCIQRPSDLIQTLTKCIQRPSDLIQTLTKYIQRPSDLIQTPTKCIQRPSDLIQTLTKCIQRSSDLIQIQASTKCIYTLFDFIILHLKFNIFRFYILFCTNYRLQPTLRQYFDSTSTGSV